MDESGASESPTIEITDFSASASAIDEVKEVLELEDTSVPAQPDFCVPASSTDPKLLTDSHVMERLKEQLYLETCAKEISIFQLNEQSELQLDLHQEQQQLLHEASSAANLVSEVHKRNESLCEELAKCKSDLESAVNVKVEIEKQCRAAKSEVMEISTRAEGLRVELERSHEVSAKQLAEIAEYKTLVDALRAEMDTLNQRFATLDEEKIRIAEEKVLLEQESEKLSTALVECKDSLKSLQVENAKLNDSLALTSEEGSNHQEAKENIVRENEKLLTQVGECRTLLEVLQVENDKLNRDLLLAMEDRKELAEKSHFAMEREKLSLELANSQNLLASLQSEHCKALDELKEAKSHVEQLSNNNIRLSLPRDVQGDISSSQLQEPEQYFGLVDLKEHLEEADKVTQLLLDTIQEIYSHSMSLSKSSENGVAAGVSKLILAFESKGQHEDSDNPEVSSTESKLLTEPILLAKEQAISLTMVVKELLRDSKSAIEYLKVQKDKHLADVSLEELKVSYEALKEYYDRCEAASVETVVIYEYVNKHLSDIEAQKVELLALYDATRQHNKILEEENNALVTKIGVSQSRTVELERNMDEMRTRSDELVSSLSSKVDALSKEVADRDLESEQVVQPVRKLGEFVGSRCFTLESVHGDALDLVSFVSVSIDATINLIENLQEKIEASKIDQETFMNVAEKCTYLSEKNEMAVGVLHNLKSKLKKLVTASSGLEEESQVIEKHENLLDPLHLDNYDTLMEQISVLLNGRLQLESENNRLRSELVDKENHVKELKERSFDSDTILHLVEDVEGAFKLEGTGSNSDKLDARVHYLISFILQKYKESDDQLSRSRETILSQEMELKLLRGQIESLSFLVAQHENEIIILKESLRQGEEAFVALQADLQGKVNELEQSEQRVSSIREKLSIAVSKGKGLVVQRDNLKQTLAETSSELEKYLQELQLKDSKLEEVEAKLKTYSEAGERMEALESELSYIRNSATALRESFLLKDSVLQRIEEILEDLELPENFHSGDIIEKVDWLARSVTGNALPLADWDQKSSGGGGSYTDAGYVANDAWKEDVQQSNSSDDDLRKKYEQLHSKFYGLAEQNDMLEQSLMERNHLIQRWEEIIDRVNMPLQLRSVEPEDRIEWLVKAFSEANHRCGSLQQKFDHLDTYCEAITADLEQSQMRFADLDTALQAVSSEKEELLQKLNSSTSNYERASKMVVELEFENDKLQNEVTILQEKLSVEVKNHEIVNNKLQDEVAALQENLAKEVKKYGHIDDEIRRLEDVVIGVLQGSVAGDDFSITRGTECLGQLLQKLIEQYNTLQKSIASEAGEQSTENAGIIIVEKREKEDTEENLATASREELEKALRDLTRVKEERDRYMDINQSLACQVEELEFNAQELQPVLSQQEEALCDFRSVKEERDRCMEINQSLARQVEELEFKVQELQQVFGKEEEALRDLTSVKEERDRFVEINQSLVRQVEELEFKVQELQQRLGQEEQKSASVKEKLNVAVRKGKSLVQHRDSLKQTVEEMGIEVERLKSEIKIQQNSRIDYEEKIKDLSTYKERVEVMESETSGLKKLLADTEYFLQEKTHILSIILESLNGFDANFDNINDPVEKMKQIAKRWHDLQAAMTSSETKINKAQRSAELLLAELNEVQERNDVLQDEIAEFHSKLSELSREREIAEASVHKATSQLEKLCSLQNDERNSQVVELMSVKSCLAELTVSFYGIIDLITNVLSKEGECLYNLEMSMTSCLEPSSAHLGGPSVGNTHNILPTNLENKEKLFLQNSLLESEMQECIDNHRLADVCGLLGSQLQVFLQEIGFLKEHIRKHSVTLDERAKHLSQVTGIVCRELISVKQSLGSMTENSVQVVNIEKERVEERAAMLKNISLLFEACRNSVMEIESWKSQFVGSNLVAEDLHKLFDSSIDFLLSEECSRNMADRLLFVVRDFIHFQNEIVDGNQKDMKVTITNLQKELQEKDIQRDKICVELVNQIREAESATRSHLQDSESAKTQLDDAKKSLKVMEEERNILKQRIEELEDGQSTLKELDERARSLTSILVAKDQEIEALMQALDEEETQMEGLTNKISELERVVQQKNSDLENLQASRAKAMKKLSITVSKFDELHHLSASLLSEVEKLQSQVHERDEEISFLRQEVTRSTNDVLQASQMSHKRSSNEMHDLVTWLNSVNSLVHVDIEVIDDHGEDQAKDYKELLQKHIAALLSQLEDLRAVVQSKDMMLQLEKTKVEDLMRKEESLEATLREKDSQLSRLPLETSRPMRSSISEIVEVEPLMNKWSPTGTSTAPQVRSLRKVNSDQVAISIDSNIATEDRLDDEDDDKAHGFKSLTTSRIVPRFTRPVTDMVDGLWVSCDRMLMRQPALRLGVIMYWALMHALLATFVV